MSGDAHLIYLVVLQKEEQDIARHSCFYCHFSFVSQFSVNTLRMRLFVASVVFVLLALSFPGIVSKLEKTLNKCDDFILNKMSPVIPGILKNSVTLKDRYKIICQKYKNKIRFATLYDTSNKIPVFSAYKYTGITKFKKPQSPWMIESELEPTDAEMREPFIEQARNQDYLIKNPFNLIPGALLNHAADRETAESTLTLTNSVPVKPGFREGLWNLVENKMKENMDINCTDHKNKIVAYVLTGAVPGNEKLNDRVNIPSHVWTAFCCKNQAQRWVSQTYWAENKRYDNVNNIVLKSLEDLQNFLNKKLNKTVTLFNNNCG
ncbi:endonuclease domain-containing 1 protein-like [Misgurnus anguillicaudatus]|uniref:endonuclease domain-containing 1 protein-like n=1 Tax=Misgurnus anguillicaudatus TaxID=75329 RepID=UPI003CCF0189